MEKFTKLTAVAAPLPMVNVDTDMIIPARFLKTIKRTGLAEGLFYALRHNQDGSKKDFVLDRPAYKDAKILVVGENFGCGSSREHAPWALVGYGFQAVISTFFADIFRNNSLKNGLLPIMVEPAVHQRLFASLREDPNAEVTVDLASQTLTLPDGEKVHFPADPFAKHCLLNGLDQFGFLLGEQEAIDAFEAVHPPRVVTSSVM